MDKTTILIIEDDALITQALKEKFIREGFNVLEALDGKVGLELALNQHPNLIMLDLVMSGMNGLTVLQKLRADKWGATVPVVILTNLKDNEDIKQAKSLGVNSYMVKSDWRLSDVVDKIKSYLNL